MNLRPHHILCIQNFTGHGYSDAFTAHMTDIVSALHAGGNLQIRMTKGCDDICEMCPNKKDGVCTSLEKVSMMDQAVLDICDLVYGEQVHWQELVCRSQERIFNKDEFHLICAGCQWFSLCSKILQKRTEDE